MIYKYNGDEYKNPANWEQGIIGGMIDDVFPVDKIEQYKGLRSKMTIIQEWYENRTNSSIFQGYKIMTILQYGVKNAKHSFYTCHSLLLKEWTPKKIRIDLCYDIWMYTLDTNHLSFDISDQLLAISNIPGNITLDAFMKHVFNMFMLVPELIKNPKRIEEEGIINYDYHQ